MQLKDVAKNLTKQTEHRLDRRLDRLLRVNPSYRHLDDKNQDLIKKLLEKYKDKKRKGVKITGLTIRRDTYSLYQKRLKLGLSYSDLKKIRELLYSLKD